MAVDKLLILNNLATTFAAILVSGGYRTNVNTVEDTIKTWDEVKMGSMPWIGFADIDTAYTNEPGGEMKSVMLVKVAAHLIVPDGSNRRTVLCNMEDDIIGALGADVYRGSDASGQNAMRTVIKHTATDLADPNTRDGRGTICTLVMDVEISFKRTFARSPS